MKLNFKAANFTVARSQGQSAGAAVVVTNRVRVRKICYKKNERKDSCNPEYHTDRPLLPAYLPFLLILSVVLAKQTHFLHEEKKTFKQN